MVNGNIYGMTIKIDKSGRIVFPKHLRERLGLKPDMELEVVEETGGVWLRRAEQKPSMVQVDGLWVHQGTALNAGNWEHVLDDVREERVQSVLNS